jgi:hypothetical protein
VSLKVVTDAKMSFCICICYFIKTVSFSRHNTTNENNFFYFRLLYEQHVSVSPDQLQAFFFSLLYFQKGKSRLIRSSFCLFVGLLQSTFDPVGRYLRNSVQGHAIKGDLDTIIFNLVASAIPNWRTFRLLRWIQNLH